MREYSSQPWYIVIQIGENLSLLAWHTGHSQPKGKSSNLTPGLIPWVGSPLLGS